MQKIKKGQSCDDAGRESAGERWKTDFKFQISKFQIFSRDWEQVLRASELDEKRARSYLIVIRWYLGWLKAHKEAANCGWGRQKGL